MSKTGNDQARWADDPSVLSLGSILGAVARHWRITLALIIVGGMAGFGLTRILSPVYTATATQLVKGIPGNNAVAANFEAAQYAVSRARSYPALIYSLPVLEGVRSDTGEKRSLDVLRDSLSAANPPDTPLVTIQARAATAKEASERANSAARQLALYITELETVDGKSPVIVETAVQAGVPRRPTSPQPVLWTILGVVAGTSLGIAISMLLTVLPPRGARRAKRLDRQVEHGDDQDNPTIADDPAATADAQTPTDVRTGADHPRLQDAEPFKVEAPPR